MAKLTKVKSGRILLFDFELANGLNVDEVEIHIEDAGYDLDAKQVVAGASGHAIARLNTHSIEEFLVRQLPASVRNPKVTFRDDRLVVDVTVTFLVTLSVRVICRLEIIDETQISIVLESVDKAGPIHGIVEAQLAAQNPVLDLSEFKSHLKITGSTFDSETLSLRIEGSVAEPFGIG